MHRPYKPCDFPLPHGLLRPRLYPGGWRCDRHTPNALRGLPEIPPGPGWPSGSYLHQTPLSTDETEQTDDDSLPPAEPGRPRGPRR